LKTLDKEFVEQGGLRERMTRARLNYRNCHPKQ
jgi:four helix bundle suffix protein